MERRKMFQENGWPQTSFGIQEQISASLQLMTAYTVRLYTKLLCRKNFLYLKIVFLKFFFLGSYILRQNHI